MAKATVTSKTGPVLILVEALKQLVEQAEQGAKDAQEAEEQQSQTSDSQKPGSGSSPATNDATGSGSGTTNTTASVLNDLSEMFSQAENALEVEFAKLKLTTRAIAGVAETIQEVVDTNSSWPIGGNTTDPEFCKKVAECIRQMARARQLREAAAAKPKVRLNSR